MPIRTESLLTDWTATRISPLITSAGRDLFESTCIVEGSQILPLFESTWASSTSSRRSTLSPSGPFTLRQTSSAATYSTVTVMAWPTIIEVSALRLRTSTTLEGSLGDYVNCAHADPPDDVGYQIVDQSGNHVR